MVWCASNASIEIAKMDRATANDLNQIELDQNKIQQPRDVNKGDPMRRVSQVLGGQCVNTESFGRST
jgi:hypothetical protein